MTVRVDEGEKRLTDIAPNVSAQSPTPISKGKNGGSARKKSASLPAETVEYLKAWMMSPEHIAHPYPTEQEKAKIMADTGIELKQLTNWFVNNRKRYWKPRVEARLQKQAQVLAQEHGAVAGSPVTTKPNSFLRPQSRNDSFASQRSQSSLSLSSKGEEQISVVAADNVSTFVPSPMGSPRAVSDSSSASESGSVSHADDDYSIFTTDEISEGNVVRTETVAVHILRPTDGTTPTIEDVSVLPVVPKATVLRTYDNCALTYRFPVDLTHVRKQVISRRDVEINRMKKHYLRLFLSDAGQQLKRQREEDSESSPRMKYRRTSLQLWRDACRSASHLYDDSLPSLEEATQLFGYGERSP